MRVALRISLIYAAVVVALGIVARIDTLSTCAESCQAVSFGSAMAYYLLILPGLKTVGLLVPYGINEHQALTLVREGLSLLATAALIFLVTLLLARLMTKARASRQA